MSFTSFFITSMGSTSITSSSVSSQTRWTTWIKVQKRYNWLGMAFNVICRLENCALARLDLRSFLHAIITHRNICSRLSWGCLAGRSPQRCCSWPISGAILTWTWSLQSSGTPLRRWPSSDGSWVVLWWCMIVRLLPGVTVVCELHLAFGCHRPSCNSCCFNRVEIWFFLLNFKSYYFAPINWV